MTRRQSTTLWDRQIDLTQDEIRAKIEYYEQQIRALQTEKRILNQELRRRICDKDSR